MEDFWDLKSDAQQSPEEEDDLEIAVKAINGTYPQILRLCKAKLGTYIEIAYEWSWEEAISMIEVLDVVDELGRRDELKAQAESRASQH